MLFVCVAWDDLVLEVGIEGGAPSVVAGAAPLSDGSEGGFSSGYGIWGMSAEGGFYEEA